MKELYDFDNQQEYGKEITNKLNVHMKEFFSKLNKEKGIWKYIGSDVYEEITFHYQYNIEFYDDPYAINDSNIEICFNNDHYQFNFATMSFLIKEARRYLIVEMDRKKKEDKYFIEWRSKFLDLLCKIGFSEKIITIFKHNIERLRIMPHWNIDFDLVDALMYNENKIINNEFEEWFMDWSKESNLDGLTGIGSSTAFKIRQEIQEYLKHELVEKV